MATQASQLSFLETNTGTVNVPNNLYVAGTIYQGGVAIGSGGGGGGGGSNNNTSTTSALPPLSPRVGDIWYNSASDAVYRYEQDGVGNTYWIDFNGPTGTSGGGSSGSSTPFTGGTVASYTAFQNSITVATNIIVGTGTNSTASVGLVVATTDAVALPVGTTAQRPANPQVGMIRYNTSGTLGLEVFIQIGTATGTWTSIVTPIYTVNYLVVGGGGGGGNGVSSVDDGGGGGAGGLLQGSTTVIAGTQYTIVVGAGGSAKTTGSNSSIAFGPAIIANGGGNGGTNGISGGIAGGSGGGGGGTPGYSSGGAGTLGQGYSGGVGTNTYSAGGGGAGGPGGNAIYGTSGGTGGTGTISIIYSGTNVYYAGGGGGAGNGTPQPNGGLGGGGNGSPNTPSQNGGNAIAYTGGGGGGAGGGGGSGTGGQGGSGIVIISYANANQRASGGVVTSYQSGSTLMWVHTFTATSGVFTA